MTYNKELFPFESKFLNIGNHKLHYVDEGSGQIILFSHAPLGSSFMFRRFIEILSKQFRCIAFDYPGFGLSSDNAGETYSIVTQSKILLEFIKTLKIKNIIALGHDTGGPSVFKIASLYPKLFKGLILTDTIIFPTIEYPKIHRILNIVGTKLFSYINRKTNLLVKLTFSKGVKTRVLTKEERQQYEDIYKSDLQRRRITDLLYSLREKQEYMKELYNGFENQLNSMPSLLIYGEDDPVTKLRIPHRIHAMLSNSELHFIKNEGHFPHEGQAERMCEIIVSWIITSNDIKSKEKFNCIETI